MKRREFITLLGGAAAGWWPRVSGAQQTAMPVIGFLNNALIEPRRVGAFLQGLRETDYFDGQNVAVDYRWAENHNERLPALAADLVRRKVDVIAAAPTPAALAAKAATATIPIVFSVGLDPVALGLVASLNRPGGNATGVSYLTQALVPKRIELLHEMMPIITTIAVLVNANNPEIADSTTKEAELAARALSLRILVLHGGSERQIETAFTTIREERAGALLIGADSFFSSHGDQIAALALRDAIPTISEFREFAAAGGLMSYGANIIDNYRNLGLYAGHILKGEKPADLPVQQSTKVELVINLKTAKTFGINFPLTLLGRADEVIE
jgi:putative tryptophan/tyrosine transport system substrate-binding protein